MKYITKFEAEKRAEQLEKRWGFGVFEDEEKKKPLMPNNVARGLVEDMLMDDLNPLEDLVHKHLKNHIERYGTAKDYDSLKIFKDFERQLVLPAVRSLDEKGSSMEDSEYSEFGAGNWKSDDTSQVWSAMEMDAFVDEMYHEMINDKHRSSSARLETREKTPKRFSARMNSSGGTWDITVETEGGKTVYEYQFPDNSNGADPEDEQTSLIDDGFLKHTTDYKGLANYMVHIGVMQSGDELFKEGDLTGDLKHHATGWVGQ